MKPSILLIFCCIIGSIFSASNTQAQESRYHTLIISTDHFTDSQLANLSDYLNEEYSFVVRGGCREQGLVLIEFPTSLAIRMNQAESQTIQAVQELWNKKATVSPDTNREAVLGCID